MVKYATTPPRKRYVRSLRPILLPILVLIAALTWQEIGERRDDGTWALSEQRQLEIQDALKRNHNAEQYVLRAIVPGWYECYLCREGRYWLNVGEVAKIGITTSPAHRYSQSWLLTKRVRYVIEVKGDLATVREAEITRIADYPFTPENLRRPRNKRLVVPVFHKTYAPR